MRRTMSAVGAAVLVLAVAATARTDDDGPPPLVGPGQTNPSTAPAPKTPAPKRGSASLLQPRSTNRAANGSRVPSGTPVGRPRVESNKAAAPRLAPDAVDGPPALDVPPASDASTLEGDGPPPLVGPSEMRGLPERPIGSTRRSQRRGEGVGAAEPLPEAPPGLTLEPDDGADGDEPKPRNDPPAQAPRRRFGILPTPNLNRNRARSRDVGNESPIRVEPRSDPAADAALKRRLEVKIKDAVGGRARDIEVRVVDRNVVVKARADRFWNRRNVRRTIESLPALSGYKASVVVD